MKLKIFNRIAGIAVLLAAINTAGFSKQVSYADNQSNAVADNNLKTEGSKPDNFDGLSKTVSKSYPADASDVLIIKNMFGTVTVNTWDKSEFKVDVQIKVTSPDEATEKRYLDNIIIKNNKTGNEVYFETVIEPTEGKNKMNIDYTIYMPSKNALSIKNEFGVITLPDMQGKMDIMSMFGGLTAKSLPNPDNIIHIQNGSIISTIEYLKATDLNVEFSKLELNNADQLHANINFGNTTIRHITTSARISVSHGSSFEMEGIDKNVRSLNIHSSFTNIKLTFNDDFNGEYDVNAINGNFKYSKSNSRGPAPESRSGWNNSHSYAGPIGKGDPDRLVNVNSSFGNVVFD